MNHQQWFNRPVPIEKLVDRKQQIRTFTRHLDYMVEQVVQNRTLFEWCGGPGIGKSQLVRLLAQECDRRGVFWARIDFFQAKQEKRNYSLDPMLLFEDIIKALKPKASFTTHRWEIAINVYRQQLYSESVVAEYFRLSDRERNWEPPLWLQALRDVVQHFQDLLRVAGDVSQTQKSRPLVLFFDETEYADDMLMEWLEEWVVAPVMHITHCVIVWMSRQGFRWKSPNVRLFIRAEELHAFQQADVYDYVKVASEQANTLQELSGFVHQITNGHPFANRIVVTQIDNWGYEGQNITSQFIAAHRDDLYREIYHVFVKNYALQGLSERLVITFQLMAILRRLDLPLMEVVLRECASDMFKEENSNYFARLAVQMESQKHLFLFSDEARKINPDLCFLIRSYCLVCEVALFKHVHNTALRVYRQWLEQPIPMNHVSFIIEELYHLSSLKEAGETVDLIPTLQNRLVQFQGWFLVEEDEQREIRQLKQRLEDDRELQSLLTKLEFLGLKQAIERFETNYMDEL